MIKYTHAWISLKELQQHEEEFWSGKTKSARLSRTFVCSVQVSASCLFFFFLFFSFLLFFKRQESTSHLKQNKKQQPFQPGSDPRGCVRSAFHPQILLLCQRSGDQRSRRTTLVKCLGFFFWFFFPSGQSLHFNSPWLCFVFECREVGSNVQLLIKSSSDGTVVAAFTVAAHSCLPWKNIEEVRRSCTLVQMAIQVII